MVYVDCEVWWDVRIQLKDMELESHIGSMRFYCEVYMASGSLITITSFFCVILIRFLLGSNISYINFLRNTLKFLSYSWFKRSFNVIGLQRFIQTMRAIQGALIVASSIQIILGYSQVWGLFSRYTSIM